MKRRFACRPARPTVWVEGVESRTLFAISFLPAVQSPAAGAVSLAAAGDYTGDGAVDLVVRDAGSDLLRLLIGRGDGTFVPSPAMGIPGISAGPRVVGLAAADVNRDGNLDVVVVNATSDATSPLEAGGIGVLLGNGSGGFSPVRRYAAGPSPTAVAVGDFNRDGWPDLAVANDQLWPAVSPTGPQTYAAAFLLGTNSGFTGPIRFNLPAPSTAVAAWSPPLASTAARLRVTVAFAGPLSMSASPLPWTLAMLVNEPLSLTAIPSSGAVAQVVLPGDTRGVAMADFNRDGAPDLAALQSRGSTATNAGEWSVHTVVSLPLASNTSPPTYAVAGAFSTGLFSARGIAAADLDRDGRADVVVGGLRPAGPMLPAFQHGVAALAGAGGGLLRAPAFFATNGASPNHLVLADANRDGRADVVVMSASGISTLLNRSLNISAAKAEPADVLELESTELLATAAW